MKKIEVILPSAQRDYFVQQLKKWGQLHYSRISGIQQSGCAGSQYDDDITGVFSNDLYILICSDEKAQEIHSELTKLVRRSGGLAYSVDCTVIHK